MTVQVTTEQEARALARELQRPGRRRPVLVISTAAGAREPYPDVADIEEALAGLCDVRVLPTGAASWAYSQELPDGCQVYGGASRVYPVDLGWIHDVRRSPLRFAYSERDRERVTEALITDALAAVRAGGQLAPSTPAGPALVQARGVVKGLIGNRGLVELDRHGGLLPAVVLPDLVAPGVPAERLLAKGMPVTGVYDRAANRLDVAGMVPATGPAVAALPAGSRWLARVAAVARDVVHVEVIAGQRVAVSAYEAAGDATTDLRTVFTPGEVVGVEVTRPAAAGAGIRLAVLAGVDLATVPALAILPGGPPWLLPPPPPQAIDDESGADDVGAEDAAAGLGPLPAADGELAALRVEHDALLARLESLQRGLDRSRRETAELRTQLRTAKGELKGALEAREAAIGDLVPVGQRLFADRLEELRFRAYAAWAGRTTPADKEAFPWRDFAVSDHFLATWEDVEGIDADRVVNAVADVATGRADGMHTYEVHQLRTGAGGDDPPLVRGTGETCWRLSLQRKTPSARRLHYWRRSDGSVELSSVRLHDDYRA